MKNLVSNQLVQQLQLPTCHHPSPYTLSWVSSSGANVKVEKVCLVKFSIQKYVDEVLCDVVPMDCCDLLLGHPFQYDRHAIHDGRSNVYTLKKYGNTYHICSQAASVPLVYSKNANKLIHSSQ